MFLAFCSFQSRIEPYESVIRFYNCCGTHICFMCEICKHCCSFQSCMEPYQFSCSFPPRMKPNQMFVSATHETRAAVAKLWPRAESECIIVQSCLAFKVVPKYISCKSRSNTSSVVSSGSASILAICSAGATISSKGNTEMFDPVCFEIWACGQTAVWPQRMFFALTASLPTCSILTCRMTFGIKATLSTQSYACRTKR